MASEEAPLFYVRLFDIMMNRSALANPASILCLRWSDTANTKGTAASLALFAMTK
jgi:hypothetical protein